ncbi:MAG: hypothetical protein M1838_003055, partial [Thelocarpon superellum]
RGRTGQLIVLGVGVYAFTAYGTYVYQAYRRAAAESQQLRVPLDVSDRYNATATSFDRDVERTEKYTGILRLRKKLAQRASGDVLEVSAGTGRNLSYYSWPRCHSLTLVDLNKPMLNQAGEKFRALYPTKASPTLLVQDAATPIPAPSPRGFDTIVQTMGLCSTPAPVLLLRNLGRLVNPDRGRILLLEHGRSHYQWLNRILDSLAPAHADKHGCWWNRDIGAIVSESGLEVVEMRRYHLGTTWWFELRPRAIQHAREGAPSHPIDQDRSGSSREKCNER